MCDGSMHDSIEVRGIGIILKIIHQQLTKPSHPYPSVQLGIHP